MITEEKARKAICKNCSWTRSCLQDSRHDCRCIKAYIEGSEAGREETKKELEEEIIKLREEIVNNANCLNCGRYGGSFCHRKHAKTFFHKKQSIAIYAPCKDWVSENSKMRNDLI